MEKITIGKLTLSKMPDGSLWIQQDDGEAGQFPVAGIEKIIQEYYDKNF